MPCIFICKCLSKSYGFWLSFSSSKPSLSLLMAKFSPAGRIKGAARFVVSSKDVFLGAAFYFIAVGSKESFGTGLETDRMQGS